MAECGSRGSVHGVPLLVRHLVDHSIPCEASIVDKNVDLRSINAPEVASQVYALHRLSYFFVFVSAFVWHKIKQPNGVGRGPRCW